MTPFAGDGSPVTLEADHLPKPETDMSLHRMTHRELLKTALQKGVQPRISSLEPATHFVLVREIRGRERFLQPCH